MFFPKIIIKNKWIKKKLKKITIMNIHYHWSSPFHFQDFPWPLTCAFHTLGVRFTHVACTPLKSMICTHGCVITGVNEVPQCQHHHLLGVCVAYMCFEYQYLKEITKHLEVDSNHLTRQPRPCITVTWCCSNNFSQQEPRRKLHWHWLKSLR